MDIPALAFMLSDRLAEKPEKEAAKKEEKPAAAQAKGEKKTPGASGGGAKKPERAPTSIVRLPEGCERFSATQEGDRPGPRRRDRDG